MIREEGALSSTGNRIVLFLLLTLAAVAASLCASGPAFAARAPAATGPGSLEICKAPDNGANGVSFSFTATNLTTSATLSVNVTGGSCSAALTADPGKWQVQENLSSGLWNVAGVVTVPASAWVSEKDSAGWAKVMVTSAAETQVTFTDAPASATLKVCKWSRSPSLQGSQFSFTIAPSTVVTAIAGTSAASAGCSAAVPVQPGSRITVTENTPADEKVADVRVGTSNASLTGWKNSVAKVTVGTGANVVIFENESLPPPQNGYVEVCKDYGDQYVEAMTTPFTFTIKDSTGFTDTEHVPVDQCTGPIQVAAGNVSITETPTPNLQVTAISSVPGSQLGPINLANGTATVVVPVSTDTTNEVQVHFVNSAITASLKVCKYLTASSGMLAGMTFNFTVSSANGTSQLPIVASTSTNGACNTVAGAVPVGSTVTVSEAGVPYVSADGQPPGTGETQTITVGTGTNIVSFTNQAYGQLEICKTITTVAGDPDYSGTVFNFSVNGTALQVAAGRCSVPVLVPAGTANVSEVSIPNGWIFDSSTATGPLGDSRATSGTATNAGNPMTVTVPWFGDLTNGGETLVTIANRLLRVQLKICKLIDPGSVTAIGSKSFSFNVNLNGSFLLSASVSPPYPGPTGCTGLLLSWPIIQPGGAPTSLKVKEQTGTGYAVSAITVDNAVGTPVKQLGSGGYIQFNPGAGPAVVTVTNASA
jgi:hypothetical protein